MSSHSSRQLHSKGAAREYKRKQIETAKPGHLIVMLYDAILESLSRAEEAQKQGGPERIEVYSNALIRAQDILTELMVALDMERGGDIAKNLFRLYEFMHRRLVDANITRTMDPIHEVRELLGTLREAWVEIKDTVPAKPNQAKRANINIQG